MSENSQVVTGEIVLQEQETELSIMSENTNDTSSEEGSVLERRSSIIDMIMENKTIKTLNKTNVHFNVKNISCFDGRIFNCVCSTKCDETICTLVKISEELIIFIIVVTMNGATFLVFLILYFIEVKEKIN